MMTKLQIYLISAALLTGLLAPVTARLSPRISAATRNHNCIHLPSGQVSWWPAEETADDFVDDNDGTLQNGVTFSSGIVGRAFKFDGTSGYVSVENSANLMLINAITIEAWFKTRSTSGQAILYKHGADGDRSYGLQIVNQMADFFVVSGGVTRNHLGVTNVADGRWHYIVGVFDGPTLRHELYVDGVLENNLTPSYNSIDVSTVPIWIGAGAGTTSAAPNVAFFSGSIDEVAIFDRALSAREIASIYHADSAGKCREVTICHKPGTPAQRTKVIPVQALSGHLAHGDTFGSCY
jgi:hypothetical protein